MGRFEDLLAQAREGDTDALDALEQEFSGSSLREKAEQADDFREKYQSVLPHLRQARLAELTERLSDELKEVNLSVSDFGDFDPDSLSLEQVQDRAQAKIETVQAQRLASATEAGFDSVEEYESALQAVKQQRENRKEGMEAVGGAVASSGGEPGGTEEPSQYEAGRTAFEAAKGEGRADDYAMSDAINAILTHQAPAEESA